MVGPSGAAFSSRNSFVATDVSLGLDMVEVLCIPNDDTPGSHNVLLYCILNLEPELLFVLSGTEK